MLSIGQIAAELGQPMLRVKDAVGSRKIPGAARAGHYRLYKRSVLGRVRRAIAQMDKHNAKRGPRASA